jgi:hypothetical protein
MLCNMISQARAGGSAKCAAAQGPIFFGAPNFGTGLYSYTAKIKGLAAMPTPSAFPNDWRDPAQPRSDVKRKLPEPETKRRTASVGALCRSPHSQINPSFRGVLLRPIPIDSQQALPDWSCDCNIGLHFTSSTSSTEQSTGAAVRHLYFFSCYVFTLVDALRRYSLRCF